MQFIIKMIKLLLTKNEQKMNLGRWNIDYCNKRINRKIDFANEDHCGACDIYKNIKK